MSKQKNDDLEVAKRTREYINFFINEYINWGDLTELFCFSFNEMNKAFNSNFKLYFNIKSCLMLEELLEYIELINDKKSLQGYVVERLPNEIFIRRPLIVNNKYVPVLFTENIPQKFDKDYSTFISNNEIEINKCLKEKGLILRLVANNENEYIITYKTERIIEHEALQIAEQLQETFLTEKTGFEKPVKIEKYCSEYDVIIDESVFEKAIEYANSNLIDIKITYNKKESILKSKFNKIFIEESAVSNLNYDLILECPVCGIRFAAEKIKNHILEHHTSWKSRCSILQQLDYDKFYCNHCSNGDLRLHSASYVASIGHITGECKNKDFWDKKKYSNDIHAVKMLSGIWEGSIYSDDSSFLGNSGQLFRDNGKFGSYPLEDNYE